MNVQKLAFVCFLTAVTSNIDIDDEYTCNVQQTGLSSSMSTDSASVKIHLVTSVLTEERTECTNKHIHEIDQAVKQNYKLVTSEHLGSVHVLLQTREAACNEKPALIRSDQHLSEQQIKARQTWKSEVSKGQDKFHVKDIDEPPNYADFLNYSCETPELKGQVVLVANADVVFDGTLDKIDVDHLENGGQMRGYVLSVKPPPVNSDYKQIFGDECSNHPRCTLGRLDGWVLGGASWDAYIFKASDTFCSALGKKFERYKSDGHKITTSAKQELAFPMFSLGAENKAALELDNMGVNLSNPCMFVNAFHWHCQGTKMHADPVGADMKFYEISFHNLNPCGQGTCRQSGIKGLPDPNDLCDGGFLYGSAKLNYRFQDAARQMFRNHENIDICCSDDKCDEMWKLINSTIPKDGVCHKFLDEWGRKEAGSERQEQRNWLCMNSTHRNCVISHDYALNDEGRTGTTVGSRRFYNQLPWRQTKESDC